ncbi:MAG: hypothetical protein ACJ75J_09275 [Cytophagaceae bacterium]
MKEERERFDLIERYLQDSLSGEEKALAEDKIKNDASFAEEVETARLVNSVVIGAGMDQLRDRMSEDIAKLDLKNKNRFKGWAGGTILFLGLCTAAYFYLGKQDKSDTISLQQNTNSNTVRANPEINVPSQDPSKKSFQKISSDQGNTIIAQQDSVLTHTPDQFKITDEISKDPDSSFSKSVQPQAGITVQNNQQQQNTACNLSFRPVANATCQGESKGSIQIGQSSIQGAHGSCVFMMATTGEESNSGNFYELPEGMYTIIMKDQAGCSVKREVIIASKNCTVKKSFSLNPDAGEIVKIPFSDGESGRFTIYNHSGIVIFKGRFGSGESGEWTGTDMNGGIADIGMYTCIQEFTGGKTSTIQITVIR